MYTNTKPRFTQKADTGQWAVKRKAVGSSGVIAEASRRHMIQPVVRSPRGLKYVYQHQTTIHTKSRHRAVGSGQRNARQAATLSGPRNNAMKIHNPERQLFCVLFSLLLLRGLTTPHYQS